MQIQISYIHVGMYWYMYCYSVKSPLCTSLYTSVSILVLTLIARIPNENGQRAVCVQGVIVRDE